MMRKALFSLLTGATTVTTIVPASAWYQRGAVPDRPATPYGVLGWEPEQAKSGGRYTYSVQVWVHDNRGDYSRIDACLKAVRDLLESTVQYAGTDGVLAQLDYRGASADSVDTDTDTNTRFSQWEIVGRRA